MIRKFKKKNMLENIINAKLDMQCESISPKHTATSQSTCFFVYVEEIIMEVGSNKTFFNANRLL